MPVNAHLSPVALPPGDLQKVLDALDAAGGSGLPARDDRRSRRLSYRSLEVVIRVITGRDEPSPCFWGPTRNISAGGLAFLHRQALAVGQELEVDIPLLDRQVLCVEARVVRCRHVKGMVHEIGVEFLGIRR
jgi:hypothetical protein